MTFGGGPAASGHRSAGRPCSAPQRTHTAVTVTSSGGTPLASAARSRRSIRPRRNRSRRPACAVPAARAASAGPSRRSARGRSNPAGSAHARRTPPSIVPEPAATLPRGEGEQRRSDGDVRHRGPHRSVTGRRDAAADASPASQERAFKGRGDGRVPHPRAAPNAAGGYDSADTPARGEGANGRHTRRDPDLQRTREPRRDGGPSACRRARGIRARGRRLVARRHRRPRRRAGCGRRRGARAAPHREERTRCGLPRVVRVGARARLRPHRAARRRRIAPARAAAEPPRAPRAAGCRGGPRRPRDRVALDPRRVDRELAEAS